MKNIYKNEKPGSTPGKGLPIYKKKKHKKE